LEKNASCKNRPFRPFLLIKAKKTLESALNQNYQVDLFDDFVKNSFRILAADFYSFC